MKKYQTIVSLEIENTALKALISDNNGYQANIHELTLHANQ
jgi:hypothetical protein